jgi:hypothetical protein
MISIIVYSFLLFFALFRVFALSFLSNNPLFDAKRKPKSKKPPSYSSPLVGKSRRGWGQNDEEAVKFKQLLKNTTKKKSKQFLRKKRGYVKIISQNS